MKPLLSGYQLTERHGFFLYLYLVSNAFLIYLIVHVTAGRNKGTSKIVENHKVIAHVQGGHMWK